MAARPTMTEPEARAALGGRGFTSCGAGGPPPGAALGFPSCGAGERPRVDSRIRGPLKAWLRAYGVPSAIVDRMRVGSLAKAWAYHPQYADRIVANRGEDRPDMPDSQDTVPAAPEPHVDDGRTDGEREADRIVASYAPSLPAGWRMERLAMGRVALIRPDGLERQLRSLHLFDADRASAMVALARQHENLSAPEQKDVPPTMKPEAQDAASKLREALAMIAGAALDEDRVISLIREHAPRQDTVTVKYEIAQEGRPIALPEGAYHEALPRVLTALGCGLHVYLVGPAGCGKTILAEQAAKALALEFRFNGAIASEYKLSGFIDAHGRCTSPVFRQAYEHGGLYLFDEIDGSSPQALLYVNTALANGVCEFPDGMVRRHESFRCIGAANTFGTGADRQYVGRNQLDAASLDRFVFVEMDYDEKLERQLAGDTDWTSYVQKVRAAVRTLKVRHVVSFRASLAGRALLAAGMARPEVEAMTIWKGVDSATREKIETAMR